MANTVEYNYFLPKEVLTYIFGFLDRHILVYRCRLVCRFWKEAVESSVVWKTQIIRAFKNEPEVNSNILSKAHIVYPWYMCYVLCKNMFYRNLLPNRYVEDNLLYWRDILSGSEGLITSAPVDAHPQGYSPLPPDLIDEGLSTCYLTTFGDCSFNQTINLFDYGFTRKVIELRPPIHVSVWFAVGYNFGGMCHLEVLFYDSKCKRHYEDGQFQYTRRIANQEWHRVTHTITNYRPDIRYVRFNHGVDTFLPVTNTRFREITNYGYAAAKLVGAKLFIALPDVTETPDSE